MENLKNKNVSIKSIDCIPVSKIDIIQVKDVKLSPGPSKKNYKGREGLNLWDLKLKPGGKATINIEFTLAYPRGVRIQGL